MRSWPSYFAGASSSTSPEHRHPGIGPEWRKGSDSLHNCDNCCQTDPGNRAHDLSPITDCSFGRVTSPNETHRSPLLEMNCRPLASRTPRSMPSLRYSAMPPKPGVDNWRAFSWTQHARSSKHFRETKTKQ